MRLMRRAMPGALGLALLCSAAAEESPGTPGRLALVEGDALVQADGSGSWVEAPLNLPIGRGDAVWVPGSGRVEIQLPTGHAVRLGDATQLVVQALPDTDEGVAELSLVKGVVRIVASASGPAGTLRAALGQAMVSIPVPVSVRLDVFPDGSAQIAVDRAAVRVETPAGVLDVASGKALTLAPARAPVIADLPALDAFDRWSEERDRQRLRAFTEPLPAAMAPYAADLAAHGRWMSIPGHGLAWAPLVDAGWTPFRAGRWIGWRGARVWLTGEPWGWAPYHYGRWRFYPGFGWVWVPPGAAEGAVSWHPGAVAWIEGPDVVAWVPLAPGEPDPARAPESVTTIVVNQVSVTQVFVNARIDKGVVVAPRRDFVGGRFVLASPSVPVPVWSGRVLPNLSRGLRLPSLSPAAPGRSFASRPLEPPAAGSAPLPGTSPAHLTRPAEKVAPAGTRADPSPSPPRPRVEVVAPDRPVMAPPPARPAPVMLPAPSGVARPVHPALPAPAAVLVPSAVPSVSRSVRGGAAARSAAPGATWAAGGSRSGGAVIPGAVVSPGVGPTLPGR